MAERRTERLEERDDRRLDSRADVDRARDLRPLERPQRRLGHVADVHVVARLQAVAVDDARLAPEESVREDGDHARLAVRVLPRPVDVGEAEDDPAQPVQSLPASEVQLRRHLGRAVGGDRTGGVALGRRDHVRVAVAGAPRRDVDEAPGPGATGALEKVEGPEHVDLGIELRIRHRAADGGLSREMDDGLGRLAAEDVVERRGADVDDMEPRGHVDLLPQTAAEIVHDRHPVAGLDAAIDHVGADETRAARHEDLHVAALCGDDREACQGPRGVTGLGAGLGSG